jgi:hypothetical protein
MVGLLVLLIALLLVVGLAIMFAILLARWRPRWSYLKVALLAAAPLPVLIIALFIFQVANFSAVGAMMTAAVILPLFVLGVMAGAVGAWLAPRPPSPVASKDEIENIFR